MSFWLLIQGVGMGGGGDGGGIEASADTLLGEMSMLVLHGEIAPPFFTGTCANTLGEMTMGCPGFAGTNDAITTMLEMTMSALGLTFTPALGTVADSTESMTMAAAGVRALPTNFDGSAVNTIGPFNISCLGQVFPPKTGVAANVTFAMTMSAAGTITFPLNVTGTAHDNLGAMTTHVNGLIDPVIDHKILTELTKLHRFEVK